MDEAAPAILWLDGHRQHAEDSERRLQNATACLRLIKNVVPLRSVADFGCGIGAWLSAAQKLGATDILGLDGEWVREAKTLIPQESIRTVDLAVEWPNLEKRFDLAISIEVAEHLPETSAKSFVKSLTQASEYVLFSAATPGQGGRGHVNEQPIDYWVNLFWSRRFVPLDPIRPFIHDRIDIYPWLRHNLVMFVSYSEFLRNRKLLTFARTIPEIQRRYKARQ